MKLPAACKKSKNVLRNYAYEYKDQEIGLLLMMRPLWFLLLIGYGHLYGQNNSKAASIHSGKLIWKATYEYVVNPYDTAFGFYNYYLRSLTYTSQDVISWTITLPDNMQHYLAACIYDKGLDHPDNAFAFETTAKVKPDINNHKDFLRCPEFISDHVIVVSHKTGLLLLNRSDGTVIMDIRYIETGKHFFVDSGRYTINIRNANCSGAVRRGAAFISHYSKHLFHFNGNTLYVFNRKNQLIKTVAYNPGLHGSNIKSTDARARLRYKNYTIEITGIVYLK